MTTTQKPEIITTQSGRKVAIIYHTAGQNFGTYAELRSGRTTVAYTDTLNIRPLGFFAAARADAIALAATL